MLSELSELQLVVNESAPKNSNTNVILISLFVSFYSFLFLTHKAFQLRPVFLIGFWTPNFSNH